MIYDYNEARKRVSDSYAYIRLKYERKYYRCEFYDGMRIAFQSIPQGKYRYETRHPDIDLSYPVSIAPLGKPIIVNFCGTIVSDMPIAVSGEKRIMEILYPGDCKEDYAKTHCK